jgi:hypothetical protein
MISRLSLIKRIAISINIAVILFAIFFYRESVNDLEALTSRLSSVERGFNEINNSHLGQLDSANAFISKKIADGYLDKIDNDSLQAYIIMQGEAGQYYTNFQEGIRHEILEISDDIIVTRKKVEFVILAVIILTLFNLVALFVLNRPN